MACHLKDILTDEQVHHILYEAVGQGSQLLGHEIEPAAEGLSGFQGDHYRLTFHVRLRGSVKKVQLFVKGIPKINKPKASQIDEDNVFRKESFILKMCKDMRWTEDPNPWCVKAYIHDENIVVMPDLTFEGYVQRPTLEYLDMDHVLMCVEAIARFHAAFANYETGRIIQSKHSYSFNDENGSLFEETTFKDSPWLRAAAKLTVNILAAFSNKYREYPTNLEDELDKLLLQACESLSESKETLNVILHKDLWVNNILFKYDNGVPVNAVLIDYQCCRYGPPAFDLMIFLCLTTSRNFRERYERAIQLRYYSMFCKYVDDSTRERLRDLNYDYESFLTRCETARMFGLLEAITIFPYVMMEPQLAQKTFDDPETYMKYLEDRTAPVLAHARECVMYRDRQLEVCEEFVERYVLKQQ